jgi:phosphoenolpyruvate carboxykinase (ATP)
VYLVNTGWTGGSYTSGGKRFPIAFTRALLDRVLDGSCLQASQDRLPGFDLCFPTALPGLDAAMLDPRKTWTDQAHFAKAYQELYQACVENFKQYEQEPALAD